MLLTGLDDEEKFNSKMYADYASYILYDPSSRDREIKNQMKKMISGLNNEGIVI
jgi:hypothetical protein